MEIENDTEPLSALENAYCRLYLGYESEDDIELIKQFDTETKDRLRKSRSLCREAITALERDK